MAAVDGYLRALGKRVATMRRMAGLTQAALAERAGLSVEMISKIERGTVNASITILRSVAKGLGTSLGAVVEESDVSNAQIAVLLANRSTHELLRALSVLRGLFAPLRD